MKEKDLISLILSEIASTSTLEEAVLTASNVVYEVTKLVRIIKEEGGEDICA